MSRDTEIVPVSRWQHLGIEGVVHSPRTPAPAPIQIPEHDGGPKVTIVPTRVHGTYMHMNGLWVCTAVTAIGLATSPRGRDHLTVGYTWTDVDEGLRTLPDYVRSFIHRSAPRG